MMVMVMVTPTVMVVVVVVVPMTAPLLTVPRLFLTLFSRCFLQRALQRQPLFLVETFQNFLHVRHDVTISSIKSALGRVLIRRLKTIIERSTHATIRPGSDSSADCGPIIGHPGGGVPGATAPSY